MKTSTHRYQKDKGEKNKSLSIEGGERGREKGGDIHSRKKRKNRINSPTKLTNYQIKYKRKEEEDNKDEENKDSIKDIQLENSEYEEVNDDDENYEVNNNNSIYNSSYSSFHLSKETDYLLKNYTKKNNDIDSSSSSSVSSPSSASLSSSSKSNKKINISISSSINEDFLGVPRHILPYYIAFLLDSIAVGIIMPNLPYFLLSLGKLFLFIYLIPK